MRRLSLPFSLLWIGGLLGLALGTATLFAQQPVEILSDGSFFAVKRTNITTSSVNLSFGFDARKIVVEAAPDNADELCVDWAGGTAVCPAANTAGDDRLRAGTSFTLDDYKAGSVSVIAASGTLTVYVRAFR